MVAAMGISSPVRNMEMKAQKLVEAFHHPWMSKFRPIRVEKFPCWLLGGFQFINESGQIISTSHDLIRLGNFSYFREF